MSVQVWGASRFGYWAVPAWRRIAESVSRDLGAGRRRIRVVVGLFAACWEVLSMDINSQLGPVGDWKSGSVAVIISATVVARELAENMVWPRIVILFWFLASGLTRRGNVAWWLGRYQGGMSVWMIMVK